MKPALIDTDILSLFFKNQRGVVSGFHSYLAEYNRINISIITYYEILSGLKHRDAHKQLDAFLEFVSQNELIPLSEASAAISADIYADLRKEGKPLDDIDILIAGIALANNYVLVTGNQKHFDRIKELELLDWSEN